MASKPTGAIALVEADIVTRPRHASIAELWAMPTDQA